MSEWYAEVFETDAWHAIHDGFWEARDPAVHAGLITKRLGLEGPSTILDVPCGNGRITGALADLGHTLTGVDLSPSLLAKAREHTRGQAVTLVECDMRALAVGASFDAAVCWWGSFGYLEGEGDSEFARAVCASLREGGRFVIDTSVAEGLLPVFQPSGVWQAGDAWIAEERRYDMESGRIVSKWTVEADGTYQRFTTSIRLYSWREIRTLLSDAGFRSVEHFDAAGNTFELRSTGARSHIVATK
ncbi:MAG: class I SAM-dependent methyltransferase [Polyangiales bacterium]